MPALGERFRAAREARGLSLSDVAEQTRIRSVYLAAIEDENWAAIGAPVYTRGFLKTYARFLGLDADDVIAAFSTQQGFERRSDALSQAAEPSRATEKASEPPQAGSLSPFVWLAALVAVALVAFVVYNEMTSMNRAPQPVVAVASATPIAASAAPSKLPSAGASAAPSATPSGVPSASASPVGSASPMASSSPGSGGAHTVQVVLAAASWMRVTIDGNVSMEGTFPAGTARLFHGKSARLRIGNASGVSVYVDGKNVGPLGAHGDVVDRTFSL